MLLNRTILQKLLTILWTGEYDPDVVSVLGGEDLLVDVVEHVVDQVVGKFGDLCGLERGGQELGGRLVGGVGWVE